ncbi:hypothetical protein TVAG_338180 [Trichomonas vaginalis G3]|uniref:Uncharacterized protein n=1 Tax=Trichomonas vaginalis (strain ATCC PRA-98 / G3) TaxID=412133 RepID=A2FZ35_TRIV3|nr:hypothetical protein TVAGG3_0451500 [Trichomonas vaginalis G3]EAX89825.1 hypothetical protein TVAG_338180 [Trichomonas vaginalis G3]KAI5538189.1 hypothetical protein TVAGG3_0451500 [Trichomonas vaginalis G3]|eukprot:XP_001302755.1 hypothetical protein [Trichomonas vaginalis G3]
MTNIGNSAEPYSAISLRSVGFKGKIFMFSDKPISSKFEECGISWIPTTLFCNIEYEKMYTRYIIIKEFIELFYESIDRLLYFDWGDTHFQSDPFTFDDKSLHVSDERIKFGEEKFNDVWISRINFMKTEYFLNKNIICNGLILGDKDSVYKTVSILSSTWIFHEKPLNDQTIYNVLIYSHIPNEIDLHVVVDPNLASISAVILNETMRSIWHIDKLGSFCDSSTGFKPAVIHQYNRNPELTKMFSSQCHYQNTFNIR